MYLNLGLIGQLSLALYQSSRTQLLQNLHLTFMTRVLVSLQIRQITLHRLLIKNLGIENPLDSLTYRRVYPEDINERGVWGIVNLFGVPFGISAKDEELDISSLYRIPKLHMCHKTALYCWVCQLLYKTSSKIICGMNLALRFLWHQLLKRCCESDVDSEEFWRNVGVYGIRLILKNSKEMLGYMKSDSF